MKNQKNHEKIMKNQRNHEKIMKNHVCDQKIKKKSRTNFSRVIYSSPVITVQLCLVVMSWS